MSSVVIRSEQLNRFQRLNATWQLQASGQIQKLLRSQWSLLNRIKPVDMALSTHGSFAVIGLTRLYATREKNFLVNVASEDVARSSEELANDDGENHAVIPA